MDAYGGRCGWIMAMSGRHECGMGGVMVGDVGGY